MFNLENIKSVNIESIAGLLNIPLKKHGRYLQGNCPAGHVSRSGNCFSIHPDKNFFKCFNCGITGDSIKLVEITKGLSFGEAVKWIADAFNIPDDPNYTPDFKPKPIFKPAWTPKEREYKESDKEQWQSRAKAFLEYTQKNLRSNNDMLSWLKSERGLNIETIINSGLGYNPMTYKVKASDFGFAEHFKITLPQGLVIPFFIGNHLERLRIRKGAGDYHVVKGSAMSSYTKDNRLTSWIIVESELDAILLNQDAGKLINICALGSVTNRPDKELHEKLIFADTILVSLDNDNAGIKEAWGFWADNFFNAKKWLTFGGKDPCEMKKAGHNLNTWIKAGLIKSKTPVTVESNKREIQPAPEHWRNLPEEIQETLCNMTVLGGLTDEEAEAERGISKNK